MAKQRIQDAQHGFGGHHRLHVAAAVRRPCRARTLLPEQLDSYRLIALNGGEGQQGLLLC